MASFFISFLIYLFTLCPTVYFGDSGEFITAAYCLGIPHNPGYPLYCLLGHLFIKIIPWGSIAFRVNLMSAFWASAAVALTNLIIYRLTTSRIISFAFSLVLAFSSLFWSQALVAEVYSLDAFNFCLLIFILLKWQEGKRPHYLNIFFFFLGIALAGHLNILCFIPAFLLFIVLVDRAVLFNGKRLSIFFLFFLLGLSLYLYLPLRSLANPPLDWGDPENLRNFLRHITGFEHRHRFIGQPDLASTVKRIFEIFTLFKSQFSLIGLILGFAGWLVLSRSHVPLFLLGLLVFLGNFIYILFLNTAPITTTAFGLASDILLAVGLAIIFWEIFRRFSPPFKNICIFLPLILLLNNFQLCNMNNFYLARQYGLDILNNLPEKAIIFSEGDAHLFTLLYLKVVEGKREDVEVIDRGGTLFKAPEVAKRSREIEKEIIVKSGRPVYFTARPNLSDLPPRIMVPEGIAFRVAKDGEEIKEKEIRLTGLIEVRELWLERDFWVRDVTSDYLYFCGEEARSRGKGKEKYFYSLASSLGHDSKFNHLRLARAYLDSGDSISAEVECQQAISLDPGLWYPYLLMAGIAEKEGRKEKAGNYWKKVKELNPNFKGELRNY